MLLFKSKWFCNRCRLPSGKTVWLCEDHQQSEHVKIIGDEEALDMTAFVSIDRALDIRNHSPLPSFQAAPFTSVTESQVSLAKPPAVKIIENKPVSTSVTVSQQNNFNHTAPDVTHENSSSTIDINAKIEQANPSQNSEGKIC